MTNADEWRKSSFSGGGEGENCVEMLGTLKVVRDSKNPSDVLPVDMRTLVRFVQADRVTASTS